MTTRRPQLRQPARTIYTGRPLEQRKITATITATDAHTWRLYFVALPPGATVPTPLQVRNHTDADDNPPIRWGESAFMASGVQAIAEAGPFGIDWDLRVCSVVGDEDDNLTAVQTDDGNTRNLGTFTA